MRENSHDISRCELDASRDGGDTSPLDDETVSGAGAGNGWLGYLKSLVRQDDAAPSE